MWVLRYRIPGNTSQKRLKFGLSEILPCGIVLVTSKPGKKGFSVGPTVNFEQELNKTVTKLL